MARTVTLGEDRPRGVEADFGQAEPEVQLGRRSDSDTYQWGSLRGDAGNHRDTRVAERQESSGEGAPGESGSHAGRGEERNYLKQLRRRDQREILEHRRLRPFPNYRI